MHLAIDSRLLLGALVLTARLATMLALAPLMDRRAVPLIWRLAIAVPLAWVLAPLVVDSIPRPAEGLTWAHIVLEGVNSVVIGALLTFSINLVLEAVRYAGSLAGMQIGFAIVNAYDPQTNSQVSIIAQLYYLLTVLWFFVLDVHHVLVQMLVTSLHVVPPFATPDLAAGAGVLVRAYSQLFAVGLQAAAPVTLVLLLVSATMGVIVKTAPQIHVLVVGFPVKIGVGLAVIGASLVYFRSVVTQALNASGDLMSRVLGVLT